MTDPAVLSGGLDKREAGSVSETFGFVRYGEATIHVDRVGADGKIAGSCEIRAIMRPSPE